MVDGALCQQGADLALYSPIDGTLSTIVLVPCPGSALCASVCISVWQTLICWVRRHLLRHFFSKHKFPVHG